MQSHAKLTWRVHNKMEKCVHIDVHNDFLFKVDKFVQRGIVLGSNVFQFVLLIMSQVSVKNTETNAYKILLDYFNMILKEPRFGEREYLTTGTIACLSF